MNNVKSSMKMNSPLPKDLAGKSLHDQLQSILHLDPRDPSTANKIPFLFICSVLSSNVNSFSYESLDLLGECKRASKILNAFVGK
jgi:hypothetical protein